MPLPIAQVVINNGDLIVADDEGVLSAARAVEDKVIQAAHEKASTKNQIAIAIRNGMSTQQAFDTLAVLLDRPLRTVTPGPGFANCERNSDFGFRRFRQNNPWER